MISMPLDPEDILYVSEMLAAIRIYIGDLDEIPNEEREPLALRLHLAEGALQTLAQKVKQYYPTDTFSTSTPHRSERAKPDTD